MIETDKAEIRETNTHKNKCRDRSLRTIVNERLTERKIETEKQKIKTQKRLNVLTSHVLPVDSIEKKVKEKRKSRNFSSTYTIDSNISWSTIKVHPLDYIIS